MPHEPHAEGTHFSTGAAFSNCDVYVRIRNVEGICETIGVEGSSEVPHT